MSTSLPRVATSRGSLQTAQSPPGLSTEQLRFHVTFPTTFRTTAELTAANTFVGQERAHAALALGVGIPSSGFNIFVSGLTGAEKLEALRGWITQHATQVPTPCDWVYVHNFAHPDAPRAIALAAGRATRFQHLMQEMVKTLREELPKAFRQEAFDKEKSQLKAKYTAKAHEQSAAIEAFAREQGFVIQPSQSGHVILIPIIEGKPLESPEEFAKLSAAQQQEIEQNQHRVADQLSTFITKQQDLMRDLTEEIRQIERRFGDALLAPLLANIGRDMENAEVNTYLEEVKAHIVENLDNFKEPEATGPMMPGFPFGPPRERDPFLEYTVNVVVDNARTKGAPILVESSPTYLNLFGTIERVVDRFGRLVTNFT